MVSSIRSPSCAGTFYPAEPNDLHSMLTQFVTKTDVTEMTSKALIAPHAGYWYSGPVAGSGYAAVMHKAPYIKRIILLGPSHYRAFSGIAVPTCHAMLTPLDTIPLDLEAIQACVAKGSVHYRDEVFDQEHSLEVHLPFIQHVFQKDVLIVPLIVGEASDEDIASVLSDLWGGEETLILVSSDLSHFYSYSAACQLDLTTSQMIEKLDKNLTGKQACGFRPVRGLLKKAADDDIRVTTLDLRNSGDTSGKKDRVVGYGSYTFEEAQHARLSDKYRQTLLYQARQVLNSGDTDTVKHQAQDIPQPLRAMRRVFVTLKIGSRLRGCIGTIKAVEPLFLSVINNTAKSMYSDPRFSHVTAEEAKNIDIHISILSHFRPLTFSDEAVLLQKLQPHHDGLLIAYQDKQALFLPTVWEDLSNPTLFLQHLKKKAGLDHTQPLPVETKAFHFTSENFGHKAGESC